MSVVERFGLFLCLLHHDDAVLTERYTAYGIPRLDTDVTAYPSLLNRSTQGQSRVEAGSKQGQSRVKAGSKQGRSRVNAGSKQGQSRVKRVGI